MSVYSAAAEKCSMSELNENCGLLCVIYLYISFIYIFKKLKVKIHLL